METIAELIQRALQHIGDTRALSAVGDEVRALCQRFPVYRSRLA